MAECKRVVTSAIHGMSVKDVRRCLSVVRGQWSNANNEPFFITNTLQGDSVSVQTFSFMFVKGQHEKRHRKFNEDDDTPVQGRVKKTRPTL